MQRTAQQELNLPIDTAKVGIRPALERVVDCRIQSERKCFSLGHLLRCKRYLLIQGPRVNYRLDAALTTEHNQEIAHHSRLALFIEINDTFTADF